MVSSGDGLKAQYFNSTDLNASTLALTRTDSTLNFNWGNGSPDSKVSSDNFSVRWTGQIEAKTSETYTFSFNADDGDRLWVNGQKVVDDFSDHSAREASGSISLVAGQKYDIKVEYYERGGDASAQLFWQTPTIAKQIIPTSQLYSGAGSGGGSGTTYLSDLNPTSSNSGYGPVEKDRSNGESAAGDGHRLTLNGVGYDKGLGVHSYSEISYALNGATRFQSVVGVDDEVGNNGQVEFQVFADGVKLYDSGNVRGVDAGKVIDVDVSGRSTLTLKVLDGGDGPSYDHADWADAKLLFGPTSSGGIPTGGSGLTAQYFNSNDIGTGLALTKTVPTINFDWGGGSPDPSVQTDNFSARYTGTFNVTAPGQYTFATVADDNTIVTVDGQPLFTDWGGGHAAERREGSISLGTGVHTFELDYREFGGNASVRLEGSGPGFSNQVLPASFFTPTTPPGNGGGGGGSSSGPADLYAFHDSDVNVPNDAHPDGVPSYYSWYNSAAQPGWGNSPPLDWHSVTAWGQVYESEGHHPEESPNTRVQLRNDELWWLSKSTGQWTELQAPGIQGGAFNSDFGGNGGTGVTVKDETANGGGISVTAGNGFNYHFWPGARAVIDPTDIAAIYTRFQARLVLDNASGPDDRSQSHYIASGGADYWRSVDAPFAPDFSNNGGVGGGKFKFITNDWQTYSFNSIPADVIASNPPPLTVSN